MSSLGTLATKRKPAPPDLRTIRALEDLPAVAEAAEAARDAQQAYDELAARGRVLDQRTADADRYVQMQATLELRRLMPELQLAEARADSARRAREAARAEGRRAVLNAHRAEFTVRLQAIAEKWRMAEREAGSALEECHRLAAIVGFGPEGAGPFFDVIPRQCAPGLTDEWRRLARAAGGWEL